METWIDPTDNVSQLICGSAEDALPAIAEGSVGMILNDPPYAMLEQKWDKALDWEKLWPMLWRCTREKAAVAMFCAFPFTIDLANSQRKHLRYDLIWVKAASTQFINANVKPLQAHEQILIFGQGAVTYYPQKTPGAKYHRTVNSREDSIYGKIARHIVSGEGRFPISVLAVEKDKEHFHPSQKPIELLEYLIATYTQKGETILDPTMGSGSACLAARNLGRKYIGIERDKEFFEVAKKRMMSNQSLFAG